MNTDALLSTVPMFRGLEPAARSRIAERLVERRLAAGEILFHAGDPGASLFVVAEGEVAVVVGPPGRETTLARLGPGSHLGEMAVVDDAPRSTSVRALSAAELVEVPRDVFLSEVLASPEGSRALLSEMARRLRRADVLVGEHLARDAVREVEARRTFGERLADRFAAFNGSWASIAGVFAASAAWIAWNAATDRPFDPFPYVLYNLVLAIAIALQGPLLMMAQNRQAERDRAQAAADYELNLKNELGIEALRREVREMRRDLERLGRPG
jgi:uncharacterized membrane protein